MHTRMIGRFQGLALPLLLGAPLLVGGCAPAQFAPTTAVDCPPDCRLVVTIPEDPRTPPEVSKEEFYVRAGEAVELELDDRGPSGRGATVLMFPEPAFVNQQGKLVHTIVLPVNGRVYRARPECPRGGCRFKYDIINLGNEKRPPLDPWIIIHQ
jgi:hypothetical protein